MKAFVLSLLLASPLVAQPVMPQAPVTLRSLLEAPGGPLKVLEWQAGRIDETSTSDTTSSARPYALIHAVRVQISGTPVRGLRITLYGLMPEKHTLTNIFTAEFAEDEVVSLLQSIQQGEALQPLSDSHPHAHVYVQWQSVDGLIFNAESSRPGGPVAFTLSTTREGGPTMSMSRPQVESLANIISTAMSDPASVPQ